VLQQAQPKPRRLRRCRFVSLPSRIPRCMFDPFHLGHPLPGRRLLPGYRRGNRGLADSQIYYDELQHDQHNCAAFGNHCVLNGDAGSRSPTVAPLAGQAAIRRLSPSSSSAGHGSAYPAGATSAAGRSRCRRYFGVRKANEDDARVPACWGAYRGSVNTFCGRWTLADRLSTRATRSPVASSGTGTGTGTVRYGTGTGGNGNHWTGVVRVGLSRVRLGLCRRPFGHGRGHGRQF
jgi:hypothetical protein